MLVLIRNLACCLVLGGFVTLSQVMAKPKKYPVPKINFQDVLSNHKLYRTSLYLEHYEKASDTLTVTQVRPMERTFRMRLLQFKKGNLTYNRIYELRPERFYSLIFRIERRFFPELKKQISVFERKDRTLQIWHTTLTKSPMAKTKRAVLNNDPSVGTLSPEFGAKKSRLILGIDFAAGSGIHHEAWKQLPLKRKWLRHLAEINKYIDQYAIPRRETKNQQDR